MVDQTAAGTGPTPFLRRHRALLASMAAALVVYAAAGFFGVPWLIKRELPGVIESALHRRAEVGTVAFNPFVLGLRLGNFRLHDTDGSTLASFDELYVNAQLSSIWRRAATFAEVRLSGPHLHVVRDAAGNFKLLGLVPAGKPGEQPSKPPAVILQQASLAGGIVDFEDRGTRTPFRARLGPLDVRFTDFSTRPDDSGRQQVAMTLESGAQIKLEATTTMTPLRSQGRVTIRGSLLGIAHRYLRDRLAFELRGDREDISARFSLAGGAGGALAATIEELAVAVTDTHLRDPLTGSEFLVLPALRLIGGKLAWPARTVGADELQVEGLRLVARREKGGAIDLARLLSLRPVEAAPAPGDGAARSGPRVPGPLADGAPTAEPARPWHATLGALTVKDAALRFRDEARPDPAELGITGLALSLKGISNEPNARFALQSALTLAGGGTIAVDGELGAEPDVVAEASLKAEGIRLAQFQPWVSDFARVQVHDGSLQFAGQVSSAPAEAFALNGDARISGLETLDARKNERLLAWSALALDDLRFAATGRGLKISRVRLSKPYARVFVAKDQSTNIGDLLVQAPAGAAAAGETAARPPPDAPAAKPFGVRLSRVLVTGGSADYTDLSLPLPFAAHIEALHGSVTAIDTRSEEPSKVSLEGQVGQYGLARIQGLLRASAPTDLADIGLVFRNVEMTTLSPYTVKFAGHKIASGRLDLDLRYKLDHRKMAGENKVVIDKLELGEKLPSPDAIDVPLGLAIALLKDADGRIDVDMPVSGSLDDPQFRIGPVIWKAFVTLITKIVTSPFRLLGRLVGAESEDLGQIDFAPGRADLLPPEREKLLRIVDVLAKRPKLALSIPAAVSVAADTAALKARQLDETVEKQLQAGRAARGDSARDLDARTRRVLEDLYAAAFAGQPVKAVQAKFTTPPPGEPQGKPRLDEGAYLAELRRQLVDAQAATPADLDALGAGRAAGIRAALLAAGVAESRVSNAPRKDVEAKDDAVPLALELGGL
jgi:uncharacterized protein involved in outer membrane biogenesis